MDKELIVKLADPAAAANPTLQGIDWIEVLWLKLTTGTCNYINLKP